ncbi:MAG: hypothetical protein ACREFR_16970 [Limisphaerales bacterium]
MKVRFFIYSILALTGILWIMVIKSDRFGDWLDWRNHSANDPFKTAVIRSGVDGKTWEKRQETPWTNAKVVLYRRDGEVAELGAKTAVYRTWLSPHQPNQGSTMAVIAFVDPVTHESWIGEVDTGERETNDYEGRTFYLADTNFFIETGSGIFEGSPEIDDGSFTWLESPIAKATSLDALIHEWEQKNDGSYPFSGEVWISRFIAEFPKDTFSSGNFGEQSIPIQRIEITHGKLGIVFYSFKYGKEGSAWLDLKTLCFRRGSLKLF